MLRKKIIGLLLLATGWTACTQNFDEINTDPNRHHQYYRRSTSLCGFTECRKFYLEYLLSPADQYQRNV